MSEDLDTGEVVEDRYVVRNTVTKLAIFFQASTWRAANALINMGTYELLDGPVSFDEARRLVDDYNKEKWSNE